jgi:mRNA-decapping enzyme subunit 2
LPPAEIETTNRIYFQVEQAHWFYEDFLREEDSSLPGMTLKKFGDVFFK